jgi:hemolysin activation/secretion protein
LGLALVALAAPFAQAQVAPDAGTILRQERPPPVVLPPKPPPPLQIEEPAPRKPQPASDIRFILNGVRITGQTAFTEAELLGLVQDLIGKEISLADLEQAAARVSRHYRQRGYVVARAYLPAQELRDGRVEIAVLEGRVGRVVIENRSRVRDAAVTARVAPLQGQLVLEDDIDRRMRLIYELSGIAPGPQAALQPGANVGETDLVLKLEEGPSLSGSVEFDNHGNRFTGGNRISAQVNVHSPTGSGDLLTLRATEGDPGLSLYRLSYQIPVSASGLRLGGDYSHVRYRLGKTFSPLEANGTADTWLAFVSHPLVLGRTYSAHARVSYQQSDIQDRIDSTATVTDKATRLATFAVTGDWLDAFGGGGANGASLSLGLGDLNIKTPLARAIDDVTARTNGGYRKWNLSLTRLQRLTANASLYLLYTGQKAGKNLDSSEKFALGGPNGVKAYPQGEALGDSGYLLNAELRYDLRGDWFPGQTQLLAFADAGEVTVNENPFAAGANRRRLSAAGLGVNWTAPQGFQLRLLVAHKLGNARATSDTDHATRGWLQLIQRF